MKFLVVMVVFVFSLSLVTWGQDKDDWNNMPDPAGIGTVATIVEGTTSVSLDSFGRAGEPSPGCAGIGSGFRADEPDGVLCQHTDYFSTGGPVKAIDPSNCTVIQPITITPDEPDHATSAVQCGECRFDFHHAADGQIATWFTLVAVIGCQPCYYSYTDYDVHGFMNNQGSWQAGEGGGLGQFVIRNQTIMPDIHYLFTDRPYQDQSGGSHWAQGEFPSVRSLITGFSSCQNLPDAPPQFTGDWTGALQYGFTRPGTAEDPLVVGYSHGRGDDVAFP